MLSKYWRHFKTVCKHKQIVLKECASCGLIYQGLIHDLSKFGFTEFISSAKYFQNDKCSPTEKEKAVLGYSKAWLHHKSHNKHHWEYWTDFDETGNIIANKIPLNYVIEMICDWIGAGRVYSKDKWTKSSPIEYYNKVRKGRYFHPDTEKLILELLNLIKDKGLDSFHQRARELLKCGKKHYFNY